MLCCVVYSYLEIRLIEAVCSLFIRCLPALFYIVCFCVQNRLLCLGLLSYNRCMSCVTKAFIKKIQESKDIHSVETLKAGVRLMTAIVLTHFVAGVLPSQARILLLLLLLLLLLT